PFIPGITGFSHINLSYLGDNPYGVNYILNPGKSSINFKASLPSQNGNSPNVSGYYDYIEMHYHRQFTADNNQLRFNTPDTNATVEYRINGFTSSDIRLYDVTVKENVNIINPVSFSNGNVVFQSDLITGNPKEIFTVGGNNYKTPVSISGKVPNQNLKGELAAGAAFIIVSPKEFLSAANRLKAQREIPGENYLKTFVVDVEKIYNEFSGGLQDPVAMRNFFKYAYNNWQDRPVYILFFGDGSYDYKNIYNLYNNNVKNWILPIERDSEFANDVDSYCSDDYIVEINENFSEPTVDNTPDFASGRICANSLEDVNNVVDKIIAYEDPLNFEKWKNINMYVADDGWTTDNTSGQEGSLHTDQCEDVAQNHTANHVKKEKLYIVSYPSEFTPQGRRKPGVNTDIINGWNDGRLVINYTGHGSVDLWAHEHVFVRQVSIPLLNNKNKYPFVTIASCDLARWDDPFLISAGEQLVNLKDKGAIGVSAAVRPVYSIPNATYNNKFYDNMYRKEDSNNPLRLGLVMYNVKQTLHFDNDLKFALICDPTIRLAIPKFFTKIDSINNLSLDSVFNMKALQKVKVSGSILRPDSSLWNDYNGKIDLNVLDVDKNISVTDFGYIFNYKQDGGIIYSGKANVVNGKWFVDFVVPRDISYSPGRGKIIAYFRNNFSDGVGYSNNFVMSGLDSTALADSTGPVISIYLDNRNFRSGDLVNQSPKLIVDFYDQSGMNLTGTIGHKIEATINDNENNKIDLTTLYSSSSGFQNGSVEYQMENLTNGNYKLEIKAWDTYNNFSSEIVDFDVKANSEFALESIYNYPNPMQDNTNFVFQHNFDSPLTADVKIYTVSGRLIKELNKTNITDKFVNIDWDGKDSDGDIIANGTYIYKIIIKTEDGSFSKSTSGKLAKLK
ncbi:MAG: type IX secretion system sortase PorU, partial [Ignavibacteria bacterium]